MADFHKIPSSLERTIEPYAEPVHITELKAHCALTSGITDFDTDFTLWSQSARQDVETQTDVALVSQTWVLKLDNFPDWNIELRKHPVVSVSSITYVDTDGTSQTIDSSDYTVDVASKPAVVHPAYNETWPVPRNQPKAVTVTFVAGYATPVTVNTTTDVWTPSGRVYSDGDLIRLTNSGGTLPTEVSTLTDYYIVETASSTHKLSTTSGGSAVDIITDSGGGTHFFGIVPPAGIQAIRLLVGHWFLNREASITGTITGKTLFAFERCLDQLRWTAW